MSTTLGEYGGGGAVTGSALHRLVPLSHIYDELVVYLEVSKEVGKERKNKSINSPHCHYHFLLTLCLELSSPFTKGPTLSDVDPKVIQNIVNHAPRCMILEQ